MVAIALLDDYQKVALSMADWSVLGPDARITVFDAPLGDGDQVAARLAGFDVIGIMRERTPFPRAVLGRLPQLKLLITSGPRNAAIDLAAARDLGITVCGTESSGTATAELTWGLILALLRNIPSEDGSMKRGGWQTTLGRELRGKTLGVIGLGRLGTQVAAVGKAFGMTVVAWSQNLTAERAEATGVRLVTKEDLLRESDVVTVHVVLSGRTRGLIGAGELALMKPSATLINTSRGPIVEQAALIAALGRGAIAGAALDVYDEEPLPPEHPLRDLPNCVLTPHLGYVTEESYRVFYGQMVEGIRAWFAGAPIRVLAP